MFGRFRKSKDASGEDHRRLVQLGIHAMEHGERERAVQFLVAATKTTDPGMLTDVGTLLLQIGQRDRAYACYHRAAETGHPAAMHNLGVLTKEDGRTDEAEQWWRAAADLGNVDTLNSLGNLLRLRGDEAGARHYYLLGAEAGVPDAMANLVTTMIAAGDVPGARRWAEALVATGHPSGEIMRMVVAESERNPRPRAEPTPARPPSTAGPVTIDMSDPLGTAERLRIQAQASSDPAMVGMAVDAARLAVDASAGDPRSTALAQSILCVLLRTVAARNGDRAALAEAARAGRAAVAAAETAGAHRSRAAGALATTLIDTYQANGEAKTLLDAVQAGRTAVQASREPGAEGDDTDKAGTIGNLVNALVLLYDKGKDRAVIVEAVHYARAAIALVEPRDPRYHPVAIGAAQALWQHCLATKTLDTFDEARQLAKAALASLPANHPNRPAVAQFAAMLDEAARTFGR